MSTALNTELALFNMTHGWRECIESNISTRGIAICFPSWELIRQRITVPFTIILHLICTFDSMIGSMDR